jgi:diadenosine tetraphosphatase ApaH/serine/threonine PP2A family protein phosphatase
LLRDARRLRIASDVTAIISDIHGNLEALRAVLAEIERRGVSDILCLGDVIGYGPDPLACLDLVMARCQTVLMGNHDFAVLYEPYNFNIGAEQACFWTRRQLEDEPDSAKRDARWRFLAARPIVERRNGMLAVHASPRRPINEYVFPDDIYTNPAKFTGIFDRLERIGFVGHTHVPGLFLEGPDFYSPDELDHRFDLGGERALVNVGSVGQPRDRDPRASFVLFDGARVEFVRIEYDIEATIRKFERTEPLDDFLGIRLRDGR